LFLFNINLGKSYMKVLLAIAIFTMAFMTAKNLKASELKAINFSQVADTTEIEFSFDSEKVQVSKQEINEDKQIIIDFKNTVASQRVMRGFDASQFTGAVVYVKAYKKSSSEEDVRVAIQLRDNVRSNLVRSQNKITLQIENRFGAFSQGNNSLKSSSELSEELISKDVKKINIPASESVEDILENLTMSGKKKYIGKKISLNLKNTKPDEMLKMIAETSGFNIITTEEIKKLEPISLTLNDIPWDQALDTILDMNKLVARKNGMILMITTSAVYAREIEMLKKAKDASRDQEPMLTKVIPLSFANIDELIKILSEYSTPMKGKISKDSRTNSLIIKDTNEVLERMKKIVEVLDTQTPQVLIESKIVEVSESYSKDIGFGGASGTTLGYSLFSGGGGDGMFSLAGGTTVKNPTAIGLSISTFKNLRNLNFNLNLMESESKGKVISSPKVITKNNVAANITEEQVKYYAFTPPNTSTATSATGGATTTVAPKDFTSQTAKLELSVTPQVTNDGSISMDISVNKDSFNDGVAASDGPKDIIKRKVKTSVLVDNGSTVVLGGIYTYSQSESQSGIPFLKDIPILGWLFKSSYKPNQSKNELIIFITPRIINQEEAGLTDKV